MSLLGEMGPGKGRLPLGVGTIAEAFGYLEMGWHLLVTDALEATGARGAGRAGVVRGV